MDPEKTAVVVKSKYVGGSPNWNPDGDSGPVRLVVRLVTPSVSTVENVTVIGVLPVWSFLQQKKSLTGIDHEIIQLMSKSAGTALEAARLAMSAPPEPGAKGYYEAFAELIA